jgi:hypothetical protein
MWKKGRPRPGVARFRIQDARNGVTIPTNGPPSLFIAMGGHVCSVTNGGQCHKIRQDLDRSFPADHSVLTAPPCTSSIPRTNRPHPRCDQGRAPLRMWMKERPRPGTARSRLGCGERSDYSHTNRPPSLFTAVGGPCLFSDERGQCYKIRQNSDRSISADHSLLPAPPCTSIIPRTNRPPTPGAIWAGHRYARGSRKDLVRRSPLSFWDAGKGAIITRTAPRHCSS